MATCSKNSVSVYRNLLKLAKLLPADKKTSTINEIRKEFRRNSQESNAENIQAMLEKANSTLGYLKIVTPKRFSSVCQTGSTTVVFGGKGGGSRYQAKAVTNWTGTNMDPDSVKRHYRGLKRAGFKNNMDVKGPLF